MAAAWLLAAGYPLPVAAAPGGLMVERGSEEIDSARNAGSGSTRFQINLERLAAITRGDSATLLMPDGGRLQGRATRVRQMVQGAVSQTVLALEGGRGALELIYRLIDPRIEHAR